jgi:hypothetical protein
VILVQMREGDDRDVGRRQPSLAQLGDDVLALLDRVVPAGEAPEVVPGIPRD